MCKHNKTPKGEREQRLEYIRRGLLDRAYSLVHVIAKLFPHGNAQLALDLVRTLDLGVQHLTKGLDLFLGLQGEQKLTKVVPDKLIIAYPCQFVAQLLLDLFSLLGRQRGQVGVIVEKVIA